MDLELGVAKAFVADRAFAAPSRRIFSSAAGAPIHDLMSTARAALRGKAMQAGTGACGPITALWRQAIKGTCRGEARAP